LPRKKKSSRPVDVGSAGTPRPLPREFKPMLANPWIEPPDGPDWIFEVKWDGYRAIAIIDHSNTRLLSRNGLSLEKKFEKVVIALKSLDLDSAIVDGEVVAVDQDGIPRFEPLQRYQQKPKGTLLYYVFDLPYLNGRDLTRVPLFRRRELLKNILLENELIRFSGAVEGEGKRFFEVASQRGLEGIVAKRKDSIYLPGRRSNSWLKIKSRLQQAAVIGGITEPSGSRRYFGALMLGVYDQGKLRYVGHTGTGFSEAQLKEILKLLTPHLTDTCPFDQKPKATAGVQWVKPKFVCEIAFHEWTSAGKLRAPAFLGLTQDTAPTEVVREHLAAEAAKR
jgi:bifunctional non-homologous end joining protein LigD